MTVLISQYTVYLFGVVMVALLVRLWLVFGVVFGAFLLYGV